MKKILKRKSIILDILLTILTLGLFNVWVQFRQMYQTNLLVDDEKRFNILLFLFLIFITLGLYFIWHEYQMTKTLHLRRYGQEFMGFEILCGVAAAFGLWFLVDSYQQFQINEIIQNF